MDLRLSVRVLNRARHLLVRPALVLVAVSVAGVAFAASTTVSTDKISKVTPVKTTGNRADSSGSGRTWKDSQDVLTALGATPTEAMTLTGIQSIGDPVALMSINQGSAATSSTAAWIDSDVTDAVSMTFSPLFAQIDGGGNWACGVGSDGSLWRWGYLGGGAVSTPVQIGADRDWAQVSVGSGAAAIKTNGSLWTFDATSSPTRVGSMTYRSVSVGSGHYLAITSEGWLAAWGSNGSGQLGTGNTGMQFNPVIISYSTDWKSVAAGGWHSAAVNNSGQLYTWGYNYYGQLGNASVTNTVAPSSATGHRRSAQPLCASAAAPTGCSWTPAVRPSGVQCWAICPPRRSPVTAARSSGGRTHSDSLETARTPARAPLRSER